MISFTAYRKSLSNDVDKKSNDVNKVTALSKSEHEPQFQHKSSSVKILDGELFSYQLSKECSTEMKQKARKCMKPVLLTWEEIREERPSLKNVSSPKHENTALYLVQWEKIIKKLWLV